MENLTFTVKALAAIKRMNIGQLAEQAGINPNHLKMVSCGRVSMTASDLQKLAAFTGIPADRIATE